MNNDYSSPPCYASELAPDYFGAVPAMAHGELLRLLCRLLAEERAIAHAAAAFMNDRGTRGAAENQLAALQRCGSKNCATLTELIRHLGGSGDQPSASIADSASELRGPCQQVEWLIGRQLRLVRSIDDALPDIEPDFARRALGDIKDTHLFNIEACEALIETL